MGLLSGGGDSITVKIVGDASQYDETIDGLSEKAENAGKSGGVLGGIGKVAGVAAKAVGVLTTATAAAGTAAVKTGMDFDTAMAAVAATSGASGAELEALRDKAKEMGSSTQFTAAQAAEALNYMAMAGWKTDEMLAGIDGVMALAAASGEDLGTTSDIVTDALTALGMTAADSGHFADILAAASANANTNVSMMGETFKYAAPLAGALGYSAEDLAVAIGLMANSGIKGSQAGTALRGWLTRMAKPTEESMLAMEELGISMTNADGSMKSMAQMIGETRTAFAGLSESEQAHYAALLAGQYGMSGFLAIVNASEEDFGKLTGAIEECDGAAESMAEIKMDNLGGDVKEMTSAAEGLQIAFAESADTLSRDTVQSITDLFQAMNAGYEAGGMDGMIEALSNGLPQVLTTLTGVITTLVEGVVGQLPTLIQGLVDALPGVLQTALESAPQIVESLFSAASTLVSGLIERLPELVPQLVTGAISLIGSVIEGIATSSLDITTTLLETLFGTKPVEYDTLGFLTGKLTKGSGNTSFLSKALVKMLSEGVDDGELSAAMDGAKSIIDAKKQELIDYIASGSDTDGSAAAALGRLDELTAAMTDYTTNFADMSTAEAQAQGATLMKMTTQCQQAVDAIVGETERLMSLEQNLFQRGTSGTQLTKEDTLTAMNWIAYTFNQAKTDAEQARDDAIAAGMSYEQANEIYRLSMQKAWAENRTMIADLIAGQTGEDDTVAVAAAITSVWDQLVASVSEGDQTVYQSELEAALREAGFDESIISQAVATVFGQQTYTGSVGMSELDSANLDEGIASMLADLVMTSFGGVDASTVEGYLRGQGVADDLISQTLAALFTADDMSLNWDQLDYDTLLGHIDFGPLGEIMQTAVESGLVEGVDDADGLDINKLILSLIAEGETVTMPDMDVEVGEVTAAEDTAEKTQAALQEAVEETPAEVTAPVDLTLETGDGTGIEEAAAQKLADAGIDVGVDANVSLNVTVSDSNAETVGLVVGESLGTSIASGVANKKDAVKTEVTTLIGGAAQAANSTSAYQKMQSAGEFVMSGFKAGLNRKKDEIYKLCKEIADKIAETMAAGLDEHSPSRVTMRIGAFAGEGFEIGLRNSLQNAVKTAETVVAGMNLNTRVLPDFESAINGAVTSVYAAENGRPIYLNINGKTMARAVTKDMQQATNNANRRIGLGVGK